MFKGVLWFWVGVVELFEQIEVSNKWGFSFIYKEE